MVNIGLLWKFLVQSLTVDTTAAEAVARRAAIWSPALVHFESDSESQKRVVNLL